MKRLSVSCLLRYGALCRTLLGLTLLQFAVWRTPAAAAQSGAELFAAGGCRGCHLWQGRGATNGPVLDGVHKRLDRPQLLRLLRNPRQHDPSGRMPGYDHLRDDELQRLVDYLLTPR